MSKHAAPTRGTATRAVRLGASPLLLIAMAGTPVMAGIAQVAMAQTASAATVTNVTDATVKVNSPATGTKFSYSLTANLTFTWSVPAGVKSGDTMAITLPNWLQSYASDSNLQIKDTAGNVIGTVSAATPTSKGWVVTYSDYVDTHSNITASATLNANYYVWAFGDTHEVTANVGGKALTTGVEYTRVNSGWTNREITTQQTQAATPSFYQTEYYGPVNVTGTSVVTAHPDSGTFYNCAAITSGTTPITGHAIEVGPPVVNKEWLSFSDITCTPDSITFTVSSVDGSNGEYLNIPVQLTAASIKNQVTTYPGFGATIKTADGKSRTYTSTGTYVWNGAGGAGDLLPIAKITAYIDDATPGAPTGKTASGADSDANTAPGVNTGFGGNQTVSLSIKNTGAVNWTSAVIKDKAGNTVGTLGGVTAGSTVVKQLTVVLDPGEKFSETYTLTAVADSGNATSSDPVNAYASMPTPTAKDDVAHTPYLTPVTVDVLANDTTNDKDYPLDPSTLTLLDASGKPADSVKVAGGTYSVSDGKVVFTPDALFTGTAPAATYSVLDELGTETKATVQVIVDNVTPAAKDDAATTKQNVPVTIDVLANDTAGSAKAPLVPSTLALVDPATGKAASTVTIADKGTFTVNAGKVVFTPAKNYAGDVPAINYTVQDTVKNTTSAKITVTVTQTAAPVANPDTATTGQNQPVTIDVLANDKAGDVALDPSTLTLLDSNGKPVSSLTIDGKGSFAVADGKVVFTPAANYFGAVPVVNYSVADVNGNAAKSTITVNVTVAPPVAAPDTATTKQNTPVTIDVLANDKAGKAPLDAKTLTLLDGSGKPVSTLTVDGKGTFTVKDGKVVFTPAKNYAGDVPAVKYQVADTYANVTSSTITVTVTQAEKPPVVPTGEGAGMSGSDAGLLGGAAAAALGALGLTGLIRRRRGNAEG